MRSSNVLMAALCLGAFSVTGVPAFEQAPTTLKGHKGTITCLAFAPDGKELASGGKEGVVILWDVGSGKALTSLPGHKDMV
ncbi:MAG TPA: hypothetical protein VNX28_12670, partial [Gemmataceae bacterium]|nr:hypothetical protein [Gemmataceae bacterium]